MLTVLFRCPVQFVLRAPLGDALLFFRSRRVNQPEVGECRQLDGAVELEGQQQPYRVFLRNRGGEARTQQLPMVPGPMPPPMPGYGPGIPMPYGQQMPQQQTIRPVFNVIPNPGSADALRRVQDQMSAQKVAMSQLKENLGYVRQVVDGLKAQLALQTSGKKS
eukprot:2178920-Rhodomonas_salina.1